jgi:hypothetical protein
VGNWVSKAVHLATNGAERGPVLRFLRTIGTRAHVDVTILRARLSSSDSWLLVEISGKPREVTRALREGRRWVCGAAPSSA